MSDLIADGLLRAAEAEVTRAFAANDPPAPTPQRLEVNVSASSPLPMTAEVSAIKPLPMERGKDPWYMNKLTIAIVTGLFVVAAAVLATVLSSH